MRRIINLLGCRFGRLTVIDYSGTDKNNRAQWLCKCDCGKTKIISSNSLRSGKTNSCGCLWEEKIKETNSIDIIGDKYGKLTVIKRIEHSKFECLCECGNTTVVYIGNLRSGEVKSCGCLSRTNNKNEISPIDLTGMRFGRLVVKNKDEKSNKWICKCDCGKMVTTKRSYLLDGSTKSCGCIRINDLIGRRFGKLIVKSFAGTNKNNIAMWNCVCDCGNKTIVSSNCLISGDTKSCGCIVSLGEAYIKNFLEKNNIKFNPQQTFPKTEINGLRYDFGILNDNDEVICLIEYDGSQHFQPFSFNKATYEEKVQNYIELAQRDFRKNEFAFKNNIPLLRIKYDCRNIDNEIISFFEKYNIFEKEKRKKMEVA